MIKLFQSFFLVTVFSILADQVVQGQSYNLRISGQVTDQNNQPVANQVIDLKAEDPLLTGTSVSGSVKTDSAGYYQRSLSIQAFVGSGGFSARTSDCYGQVLLDSMPFDYWAGDTVFTNWDVQICARRAYADFEYDATGPLTIQFSDSSTSDTTFIAWSWYFGPGTGGYSIMQHPLFTYPLPGIFDVRLTALNATSNTSTIAKYVPVEGNAGGCTAAWSAQPDTTGQYTLLIFDNSTGPNLRRFWTFGDGTNSNLNAPTHQYPGTGTYRLCLEVEDSLNFNCVAVFCDTITVTQKIEAPFSIKVVRPTVGVDNPAPSEPISLTTAPQPAGDQLQLHIGLSNAGNLDLTLYKLNGQVAMQKDLGHHNSGQFRLDLDTRQLTSGLYLLHLRSPIGEKRHRITIQR